MGAVTTTKPLDTCQLINQLGGTIKIVKVLGEFAEEPVAELLQHTAQATNKKFHFGFSIYSTDPAISMSTQKYRQILRSLGTSLKKSFKQSGRSARFVESRDTVLSSVIVQKEHLLPNDGGVEIVLFKGKNYLRYGQTLVVQPFADFSRRDYGRPGRDAKSGMLPPKVARLMLNIASPVKNSVILDPFCGSGTIITEALLLNCNNIIASDISPAAIADTKQNIAWLRTQKNSRISPNSQVRLLAKPAQQLLTLLGHESVHLIVTEGDLGPTTPANTEAARAKMQKFYENILPTLTQLLKPYGRIVIALPAWTQDARVITLKLNRLWTKLDLSPFDKPLFYGRPTARVLRHIHFLTKK